MVRIMRKNGDGGYHFMDTPDFIRRQEAMKFLKDQGHEGIERDEFLIVGSPSIVTARTETKVTLTSSSVSRGTK